MELSKPEERKKPLLLEFAFLGDTSNMLRKLKEMAIQEDWEYLKSPNPKPLPILFNYLCHTFARLKEEDKVVEVDNYSSFNTGLVTPNQQEIFMFFKTGDRGLYFVDFYKESDNNMGKFSALPERATYFSDPADLIFDTRIDLRINIDHIIDDPSNFSRFPSDIQSLSKHQLINTFNGAIEHAKKRVRRNYKTAIPQYYRGQYNPGGQLQLLLPLCLKDPSKADLALAIYKDNGFYSGRTCLTLDMAINNARLICKPDDEWLRP